MNTNDIENKQRNEFEAQYHSLLQNMTIEQLMWLNQMAIAHIKSKEDFEYSAAIRNFKRGDKVTWSRDGIQYNGWVVKTNRKTIGVTEIESPYRQWKIDPNFLKKE